VSLRDEWYGVQSPEFDIQRSSIASIDMSLELGS